MFSIFMNKEIAHELLKKKKKSLIQRPDLQNQNLEIERIDISLPYDLENMFFKMLSTDNTII